MPQEAEVAEVLYNRAADKGVDLRVIEADQGLPDSFESCVQRLNCSLARAITDAFL